MLALAAGSRLFHFVWWLHHIIFSSLRWKICEGVAVTVLNERWKLHINSQKSCNFNKNSNFSNWKFLRVCLHCPAVDNWIYFNHSPSCTSCPSSYSSSCSSCCWVGCIAAVFLLCTNIAYKMRSSAADKQCLWHCLNDEVSRFNYLIVFPLSGNNSSSHAFRLCWWESEQTNWYNKTLDRLVVHGRGGVGDFVVVR